MEKSKNTSVNVPAGKGIIAKLAMAAAKATANSACIYLLHQPKLPAQVQKLRKF